MPCEMRPGDLQTVRVEIVDQELAKAAFLAQLLLGGEARAGGSVVILHFGRRGFLVAVAFGFGVVGRGAVAQRRAFDETLVQTEVAVIANRATAPGACAVFVVVNGETIDDCIDFAAPFAALLAFAPALILPPFLPPPS